MSERPGGEELVFHVEQQGNLGNQMIQYMVALKFASLVPGCRISNVHLPTWGIDHPAVASAGPIFHQRAEQHLDQSLSTAMREGRIARIEWRGYGQRMENFLPREECDRIFMGFDEGIQLSGTRPNPL